MAYFVLRVACEDFLTLYSDVYNEINFIDKWENILIYKRWDIYF